MVFYYVIDPPLRISLKSILPNLLWLLDFEKIIILIADVYHSNYPINLNNTKSKKKPIRIKGKSKSNLFVKTEYLFYSLKEYDLNINGCRYLQPNNSMILIGS